MAFTTQPYVPRRRIGRGLRILGGIAVFLAGLAFMAHLWWGQLWRGDDQPERLEVTPPRVNLNDYMLAHEPEPEAPALAPAPIQFTTAQPEPEPQTEQRAPRTQLARTSDVEPERRKPVRLGEVSFSIAKVEVTREDFQDGRQPIQGAGCSLRLGQSNIPAVLQTAVYSELGGQVQARVTSDIYSIDHGYENKVLIPAGTVVVGQVVGMQELTIDSGRIGVVWSQMTNPRGFGGDLASIQVSLGEAWGASADGSGGMGGDVHIPWGTMFAYAALVTLFNVAQDAALNNNPYADEAAGTLGSIGEEVVRKSLDFKPKIAVQQGTPTQILIQKSTRIC